MAIPQCKARCKEKIERVVYIRSPKFFIKLSGESKYILLSPKVIEKLIKKKTTSE